MGYLGTQFGDHGASRWGTMESYEAGEWHDSDVLSKKIILAAGWRKDGDVKTGDKGNCSEIASVFQEWILGDIKPL